LTQELGSAPSQPNAEPTALVNRSQDVDANEVVSSWLAVTAA
jgi:hypothetical protein